MTQLYIISHGFVLTNGLLALFFYDYFGGEIPSDAPQASQT